MISKSTNLVLAAFAALLMVFSGVVASPATAAPVNEVSFSVYFDGDSSLLTPTAQATLASKYRAYSTQISSVDVKCLGVLNRRHAFG